MTDSRPGESAIVAPPPVLGSLQFPVMIMCRLIQLFDFLHVRDVMDVFIIR